MQGVWVQSVVGEIRSHMSHGQKNAAKKQYCNTFTKDLKTKNLWHSCLVFFNNCQLGLVASGNLPGNPLPSSLSERLHL